MNGIRLFAILCIFCTTKAIVVPPRLSANRPLPLQLNTAKGSLSNMELAWKFANDVDGSTWRKVHQNVKLIAYDLSENKARNEDEAVEEALKKFHGIMGLEFNSEIGSTPDLQGGCSANVFSFTDSNNVTRSFQIGERLGSGAYGEVKKVTMVQRKEYALKTESHKAKERVLQHEFDCYMAVNPNGTHPGIPYVMPNSFKSLGDSDVMVMEIFEADLEVAFNICGRRFSCKTLLNITLQVDSALNDIHDKSYLHRDIKPANCLVRKVSNQAEIASTKSVVLSDFGLGIKYKDDEGNYIGPIGEIAGSPAFMARQVAAARPPYPRHDKESLGYMLKYFLDGDYSTPKSKFESVRDLSRGWPEELVEYLSEVRRRIEPINRARQIQILTDLRQKRGYLDDGKMDWENSLSMLLKDPEVNKIAIATKKFLEDGKYYWRSIFLVAKFYTDILEHMQQLRMKKGFLKLLIDDTIMADAQKHAREFTAQPDSPVSPYADTMVVQVESTDIENLLAAFEIKYAATGNDRTFSKMVLNPTNFYVGFGCNYNEKADDATKYTFVIMLLPELIKNGKDSLKTDPVLMGIACGRGNSTLPQQSTLHKVVYLESLDLPIPLENIPLRGVVSPAITEFYANLINKQLYFGDVVAGPYSFGYAYEVDRVKNKLVVSVVAYTVLGITCRRINDARMGAGLHPIVFDYRTIISKENQNKPLILSGNDLVATFRKIEESERWKDQNLFSVSFSWNFTSEPPTVGATPQYRKLNPSKIPWFRLCNKVLKGDKTQMADDAYKMVAQAFEWALQEVLTGRRDDTFRELIAQGKAVVRKMQTLDTGADFVQLSKWAKLGLEFAFDVNVDPILKSNTAKAAVGWAVSGPSELTVVYYTKTTLETAAAAEIQTK